MTTLVQLLGVVAVGAFWGLLTASAGGVAVGLSPVLTWLGTVTGALISTAVVVFAGDKLRTWLLQHFGQGKVKEGGRMRAIWERYGVIGWGLISPVVFALPICAAVGVGFGAPRGKLLFWMAGGVIIWTTVGTIAAALGVEAVRGLV